jgi:ribonuclease P/MRP protein subunit RPP1
MEKQIIIQENDFLKTRKKIKENKDKTIVFSGNSDELNRKILEKEKIDILLINQSKRKDFQKQRNSGFNHVLAKIAKKNNITIGINLDEIINSSGKQKSEILSRVKQNIKLCNKNKLKMKFIPILKIKRDLHDLKALGLVLGMPTWMVKEL